MRLSAVLFTLAVPEELLELEELLEELEEELELLELLLEELEEELLLLLLEEEELAFPAFTAGSSTITSSQPLRSPLPSSASAGRIK